MNSFGDGFGFRRSDESYHSGWESGYRVPANATAATGWLQGAIVTIDPAAPGYLKLAADDAVLVPGFTGLLLQYERYETPDGFTTFTNVNTRDLSAVKPGALANIVCGAGLKLWYKNLPAVVQTTPPSVKAYDAETRVTLAGISVGSYIGWSGTVLEVKATAATAIGQVTKVTSTGVEFTLLT